jgi:hypothetical protein
MECGINDHDNSVESAESSDHKDDSPSSHVGITDASASLPITLCVPIQSSPSVDTDAAAAAAEQDCVEREKEVDLN